MKNKALLLALLSIFSLLPAATMAQASDLGNWLIYFGDKKLNQRFNWHHEVQYRNFNFLGDTEQLLLRTGLGYNLTENNNNAHLGYAFIYSEPYLLNSDQKTKTNEHRIYQQFITRQTFGRFSMQHRYRVEQRFLADDFKLRFRYFLSINIVLNQQQMKDKALYLSAYNEIFVHSEQRYFDRNRAYGGLGYRFTSKLRAEIGLMNQTTNNGARTQLNFITFLNL